MSDADFGIVIKQGNKKFRECIARKCKMSYEEALKNKDNKCRKACVAEVCAYVVKRLKEEIKKCKDSEDPVKCRENGKKLIKSYSDAYKKVTGESLTEGLKRIDNKRLKREEFLTPPDSSLISENEASKKFNQLINGMNKCTFSIKKGLRNRKQTELLRITKCKIPYLKRIINLFRSLGDERSVKVWQAKLDKQIRKAKKLKEKIQSQR